MGGDKTMNARLPMTDPFARWGATMVRLRWLVLAVWVALIVVAGGVFAPRAGTVLKAGGVVGGGDSAKAASILQNEFNASSANSVAIVFRSTTQTADDESFRSAVTSAIDQIAKIHGVRSIDNYYQTSNPLLLSPTRNTLIVVVALEGDEGAVQALVPTVRDRLTNVPLEHYVTGLPAVNRDIQKTSEQDLSRAEVFTIPIVVFLLLLVFRTVISAAIPLILGVGSVVMALSIIYIIGSLTATSIFALNVTSMIGLGLGIDFALIVVNRFREERAAGRSPSDAVVATMATAGRSITYSAVTVIAGMIVLTLLLLDLTIVRSISLAVMIVAVMALLAGLTLLPALLSILGHRIEWLRVIPRRSSGASSEDGVWYRFSHAIMRRPWAWLAFSLVILLIIASPLRQLNLIGSTPGVLPRTIESVQGGRAISEAFGANRLTPIQVVIRGNGKDSAWSASFRQGLATLAATVNDDPRTDQSFSLATLPSLATTADGLPLGLELTSLIDAPIAAIPAAPAFVGFGRLTLPAGTSFPMNSYLAAQVIRLDSGSLAVNAQGKVAVYPPEPTDEAALAQTGPPVVREPKLVGDSFTMGPGDQLSIPMNQRVAVQVMGGTAQVTVISMYVIRTAAQRQANWGEGSPAPDMFQNLPREVLGSAVVNRLPTHGAVVVLDEGTLQPGSKVPRHTHPGPEYIYVESGSFSPFEAPLDEMTITAADGSPEEGIPGSPTTLLAGGKAIVQAGQIHRALNQGGATSKDPTKFLSMRIYSVDEPRAQLIERPKDAGPELLSAIPKESFVADPIRKATTARFVNVNGNNDTALLTIFSSFGEYTPQHEAFVKDLRTRIIPGIPELRGDHVYVGGDSASFLDFRDALYGRFPLLGAMVMLMTFIILMMFFQSVFLPLKAILLNLASITATYGALVLIFQHGWGSSLIGLQPIGALAVISPAILFVILFGMSTDYEVFMLSRVKEYYHETGNNEEAVARGLQHTAGVITAAGLILVGTFGSFASADVVIVKEIGLGLAIGVLLDSTIVRVIMVPASMRLMGHWNWWMPGWLGRIVPELSEGPAPAFAGASAGTSAAARPAPSVSPSALPADEDHYTMLMPQPRPSAPQLRVTGGSVGADFLPLSPLRPFTIGRSESNELQLFDQRISRRHAEIVYRDGRFMIVDLDSGNGVYVNGSRITAPTVLRHGDLVEIGIAHNITYAFEENPA